MAAHLAPARLPANSQFSRLCSAEHRRKNYLFAGSHDAAHWAAGLYSLTRTCAQYGVPPLPYFTDVLTKLGGGWPADRMDELLPHAWKAPSPPDPSPSPTPES